MVGLPFTTYYRRSSTDFISLLYCGHLLVTGSSRGLGKAIALSLAEAGANVLVHCHKNVELANDVANDIRAKGRASSVFQADLTDNEQIYRLAQDVFSQYGHVDVLVNNAGSIPRPGNWDLLRDENLDKTINANLRSVIVVTQCFAPAMITKKSGRIINIASTYGIVGAAAVLAYTASKSGVITATYSLARELGKHGITVNAIAPGNFATDMATEAGEGFVAWVESTAPLGRLGRPEEIGEAAVFLARADYITGHVLVVDGGHILNM
jgi:3-oxoacyl-[acyl-carrier protein] reductase